MDHLIGFISEIKIKGIENQYTKSDLGSGMRDLNQLLLNFEHKQNF